MPRLKMLKKTLDRVRVIEARHVLAAHVVHAAMPADEIAAELAVVRRLVRLKAALAVNLRQHAIDRVAL
jgi:hypothetical protein